MSLDIILTRDCVIKREHSGIFVRHNGSIIEISRDDWDYRNPGHTPAIAQMVAESRRVYSANITHNLTRMAEAASIYKCLWRPEENGIAKAADLIEPLTFGQNRLESAPDEFRKYNAPNGWGDYTDFLRFVKEVLAACREHPNADVLVSR